MEVGLKQRIFELIKSEKYVTIDRLREFGEKYGYIDSNSERRCRDLRHEGAIERVLNSEGVVIAYCLVEAHTVEFRPNGKTVEELKLEAEKALKNLKFGDKRQTAVLVMMKTLKKAITDKDKIRLLTNIIYNLQ